MKLATRLMLTTAVLLMTGCGAKLQMLRQQAATSFKCEESNLRSNSLMSYVEHVSGCDQEDIFVWDGVQGKWISLRDRASFELSCPPASLAVTIMDTKTYGVAGCDQRAVYKWLAGSFVMNTQTVK